MKKFLVFLLFFSSVAFATQSGTVDLGPLNSGGGGGGGGGVTSLNTLTGNLDIVAGTGISITPSGSTIQITNTETIPAANTVFVSTAGNDSTCALAQISLPCLTVTKAMTLVVNPGVVTLIEIQDAGTYSVDGLIYKVNVFIQGANPASTILDFGNAGITIDSSWNQSGNNVGGLSNLSLLSSGSISSLSFDFSALTGNNTFNFNNIQLPGNLPWSLKSSNSGNEATFNIVDAIHNKGQLEITDAVALVFGYFNQNDGVAITSTGTNDTTIYSANSVYFGEVDVTGATGRGIFLLTSGTIFGTVVLNNATSLMQAQMGTLPANSNITNSGGTLVYAGDAYQVPYFPATPSAWPSPAPTQVSQALDTLVGMSGGSGANVTLSNLTSPTAVNQNLIFSTGSAAILQTADDSSGSGSLPLTVEAGNDTSTSGIEGGGNLILEAGSTSSSTNAGIGGSILINAGSAAGSGGDAAGGGMITIKAGSSTVPLSSGGVFVQDGNALSSLTVAPGSGVTMTDDTGSQIFTASSSNGIFMKASVANKTTTIEDGSGNAVLILANDFSLSNSAGTIFNSFNNDAKIDMDGQLYMSAYPTTPTIAGCGSGAALSAVDPSDATGAITMGTGITTCVLTFANAWVGQVHCFLNDETTTIATAAVPTTAQMTLKGAFLPGDVVDYWCVGEF